ncbi:cache domain-containing protein [Pleurocapsa sp. FMAR1]|uniref:cache domain-containing protein n=1 Tax=Pleurocapsa sp. FMAR1 TaxID=3040204 RepID=UPI0029C7E00D|nr:cache domain-containing protein [Pleurocapsa sp. FMAR1]
MNQQSPNYSTSDPSKLEMPRKEQSSSFWQKITQKWNNIPLRTKISLLLVTGATIPVVAATQGIVKFTQNELISNLQNTLNTELTLIEEEITLERGKLEDSAHSLALAVEAAEINLNNTDSVQSNNQKLESFIVKTQAQAPDANFYIITDSQGRTVAQSLQQVNHDGEEYPLLPAEADMDRTASNTSTQFKSIQLNKGINLKKLGIINDSLQLSRPLSGFELLSNDVLKSLGLAQQADIGIRAQKIEGLAEPEKPYPEAEFKIDQGKAGLVLMAVETIELGNNELGTAVVGTLINRNFDIVDRLKNIANVSTATIFAQDWRVSSNVPYTDKKTRAIGTRVSRAVADVVLKQGEVYRGNANIIGTEYQTGYAPIFSYLQQIDNESAKPIGIAYVGEPMTKINSNLARIALIGYAIGGIILIIVVAIILLSPLVKSISRPIKELTEFATKITNGNSKIRLESNPRRDEIGVLAQNLNEMAQSIDANLDAKQKEAEEQRLEKEKLELAIYTLLDEVSEATNGDLTVRANLDSLELSTVADLFNAIIGNLQDIAIEAKQSTGQVGSSLKQNEAEIRLLAEQAIAEAQETRDTLMSVEQMSQSIQESCSQC